MDFKKLSNRLLWCYYAAFLSFFVTVLACTSLLKKPIFELGTQSAITIQFVCIMYVLCSVPFALWFFHKKMEGLRSMPAPEMGKAYFRIALLRLLLITFGVLLNVVFFYLLKDMSLIYSAGIAALAFLFCKPDSRKVERDLTLEEQADDK